MKRLIVFLLVAVLTACADAPEPRSPERQRELYRQLMAERYAGIVKTARRGADDDELVVIVNNDWHRDSEADRKAVAHALWLVWYALHSREQPSRSRIVILDEQQRVLARSVAPDNSPQLMR